MPALVFSHISKVYGEGVVAIDDFDLTVPRPRLAVVLGPSGCGKTTLLRLVAGLEEPTSGTIRLGSERLDNKDPKDRGVAMVFQNYALFPHMTVAENLAFGPRLRKEPRDEVEEKVRMTAKRLRLEELLWRRPAELSGGQRQRVALGRALVREPKVFLFDEPLSNLDARLRVEMRALIKELYCDLRTTILYVTHDQVEAMSLGEMVVVMKRGRIHQVGTPEECYRHPRDTFVAGFLGNPPMNLLTARLIPGGRGLAVGRQELAVAPERTDGDEVLLGFRAEEVMWGGGSRLRLRGHIRSQEMLGHEVLVRLDVEGQEVEVRVPTGSLLPADGVVQVGLDPARLRFFSTGDGKLLGEGSGQGERRRQ